MTEIFASRPDLNSVSAVLNPDGRAVVVGGKRIIMRVDPYFISNTVAALDATTANEQTLTEELSTGVRVNSISDDPVAYAQRRRYVLADRYFDREPASGKRHCLG
jgi:hypothetical protein